MTKKKSRERVSLTARAFLPQSPHEISLAVDSRKRIASRLLKNGFFYASV